MTQAQKFRPALWALPALLVCLPFFQLGGCAAPSYYSQAISGHLGLMNKREDIDTILEADSIDPELARELELSVDIREFAVSFMYPPDTEIYTQFVLMPASGGIIALDATEGLEFTIQQP